VTESEVSSYWIRPVSVLSQHVKNVKGSKLHVAFSPSQVAISVDGISTLPCHKLHKICTPELCLVFSVRVSLNFAAAGTDVSVKMRAASIFKGNCVMQILFTDKY
jgi:hypothetical protein